jgi:hypothetical protein
MRILVLFTLSSAADDSPFEIFFRDQPYNCYGRNASLCGLAFAFSSVGMYSRVSGRPPYTLYAAQSSSGHVATLAHQTSSKVAAALSRSHCLGE